MSFDGESPSAVLYLPVKKLLPHDSSHPLPLHDPEGRRLRTQVNILPRIDMKAAAIACVLSRSHLAHRLRHPAIYRHHRPHYGHQRNRLRWPTPDHRLDHRPVRHRTSGYGSNGTVLASATTDSHGNFNIASATGCGDPEQVYIVATGGNPGLTRRNQQQRHRPRRRSRQLLLRQCHHTRQSQRSHHHRCRVRAQRIRRHHGVKIGTSATNPLGLQHAFQNAANIVDFSSGIARSTTPAGNGTVPADLINSLADILEPCVNSTSPASGTCTTLFSNATPPAVTSVTAPANTWQAALDMAQYPGNKTAALYGLMLGTPSFRPPSAPPSPTISRSASPTPPVSATTEPLQQPSPAASPPMPTTISGSPEQTTPALSNFPASAPCSRPTGAGATPPFKPPAEPPPGRSPSIAKETSGPSTTPRPAAIFTNTTPPPQPPPSQHLAPYHSPASPSMEATTSGTPPNLRPAPRSLASSPITPAPTPSPPHQRPSARATSSPPAASRLSP